MHTPPLAFAAAPSVIVAPAVALDVAHNSMVLTSAELSELCQEPLSDTGLARIAHLVSQMGAALNQTVAAHALEGERAVA